MELKEAARILCANAEVGPDPRMDGATDCYLVPFEDVEALRRAACIDKKAWEHELRTLKREAAKRVKVY